MLHMADCRYNSGSVDGSKRLVIKGRFQQYVIDDFGCCAVTNNVKKTNREYVAKVHH
jgi:translation initiation factor 2 beta subunit (eIF-2beta)/eIF-5